MDEQTIKLETSEYIANIILSRPKQMNALNIAMLDELSNSLDKINKLEDIRCIIVTGSGEKAFAAGADTKIMESMDLYEGTALSKKGNEVFMKLQQMPMPVIAAVNGYALGGGLELALSCDIRIASENAFFGLPEVTLGIMPGFGGTQRLPRLIGYSKAAELAFTGRCIGAAEALQAGMVSAVYPPEELIDRAFELAKVISANAPIGIRSAKKSMSLGLQQDINSAVEIEGQYFGMLFATKDKQEGLSAFNNRRKGTGFRNR